VQNNRTLQINGNRIILAEKSFILYNHAKIKLQNNATLTVYLKGSCSFDNNIEVNVNTATPNRFTIINLGTDPIVLGNNVDVYATIISPFAPLQMNNGSDFFGNFTGLTVILANSAGFHNDGSGGPVPTVCGAELHDTAGQAGTVSSGGIPSVAAFATWFNDVPGTNVSAMYTIDLVRNSSGVYEYINDAFHPNDNQLFGNEDQAHNYYFTFELVVPFVHHACTGTFFQFQGEDDAWMFINGKLAMDLGGVVPGTPQYVEIDRITGLQDGQTYTMRFFYAQRQPNFSTFHMQTNMDLLGSSQPTSVSAGFD
jgi:fibro-slime domain-containing protein